MVLNVVGDDRNEVSTNLNPLNPRVHCGFVARIVSRCHGRMIMRHWSCTAGHIPSVMRPSSCDGYIRWLSAISHRIVMCQW